ncbi:ABC transporter ATP-binding protein [soil metagenome]
MSDVVIKVENISKQYRLGSVGTGSFAHDINRSWYRLRGKEDPYLKIGESNDRTIKGNSEYVWALKDINFEVKQGEVLGIIGRNGAGKSTLLKILSRTTSPTTGSVKIKGRVASLLEVGTGFHPELSGRDNIFLNGAILGMTKKEINSKFDEIVDFAGVERFIDTPVKRYSSGMYVRLAFGVAAHLEPEILIVDEVLAVGDAEFQKKALGKMKDVSTKQGRTVLFVSHNMVAIQNLCEKAILLSNGLMKDSGETGEIISKYFSKDKKRYSNLIEIPERNGNGKMLFKDGVIKNTNSNIYNVLDSLSNVIIELVFEVKEINLIKNARIDVGINNKVGERIAWLSSETIGHVINLSSGKVIFEINQFPLAPGDYDCNLYCEINNEVADWLSSVLQFTVSEKDYYKTGKVVPSNQGDIILNYKVLF